MPEEVRMRFGGMVVALAVVGCTGGEGDASWEHCGRDR